jgi:hypothetical protein
MNDKSAVRAPVVIVAIAPSSSTRFGDWTSANAAANRCSLWKLALATNISPPAAVPQSKSAASVPDRP